MIEPNCVNPIVNFKVVYSDENLKIMQDATSFNLGLQIMKSSSKNVNRQHLVNSVKVSPQFH